VLGDGGTKKQACDCLRTGKKRKEVVLCALLHFRFVSSPRFFGGTSDVYRGITATMVMILRMPRFPGMLLGVPKK